MTVPVIGFSGYSGSGKTTLIERLIPCLKARGLRLAVIKHDGHDFDVDHPGKDSSRFSCAGAEMVILTSRKKTAVIEQRTLTLPDTLAFVHDVDLVLVEGFKNEEIPQIGISRKANGTGFPANPQRYVAVVTDEEAVCLNVPVFGFQEWDALADFIVQTIVMQTAAEGCRRQKETQK